MVIPPHVPGAGSYPLRNFGVRFGNIEAGPPLPYRPKGFYKNPSLPLYTMPLPPLPLQTRENANKRQLPQRQQRPGPPIRGSQRLGPPIRRPNPPFQWKGIISRPPMPQKPRIPPRFQQNPNQRNFVRIRPPRGGFRGRRFPLQPPSRPRNENYHAFPANNRKSVPVVEVSNFVKKLLGISEKLGDFLGKKSPEETRRGNDKKGQGGHLEVRYDPPRIRTPAGLPSRLVCCCLHFAVCWRFKI